MWNEKYVSSWSHKRKEKKILSKDFKLINRYEAVEI